jgi:hypothetical protein
VASLPGEIIYAAEWYDYETKYADGLARADTTLSVFDSSGNLILVSRTSDQAADQPLPNSGTGQSGVAHGHGAAPAGNSAPAVAPGSSSVVVPTGGGGTGANSGTSATPGVSEPDSYVGVMD